jgi:hypothetical protein
MQCNAENAALIYTKQCNPSKMNKTFLVGIIAGLVGSLSLAAIFATTVSQGTAQMMDNFNGQMGQGMMFDQPLQSGSTYPLQWHNRAVFSSNGISNVDHVQITGISITGDHEVTVNLRYDSNGTTPSVTVIAASNPAAFMGMMYGSGTGQGMMAGNGYGAAMMHAYAYNGTQMQNLHNQMMGSYHGYPNPYFYNQTSTFSHFSTAQAGTGSSVLNSGWQSGASVKVRLDGQGSAYDSFGIHVMLFPLTS